MGLLGGRLCLDFANTADWHAAEQPVELLRSHADLLAWCQRVDLLDAEEFDTLLAVAAAYPTAAQSALERAIALREALYSIFSRHAHHAPAEADDLATLNRALVEASAHLRLVERGPGFAWYWQAPPDALERILWPIARSAADLLTSADLARVRECAGYPCGWLFLDTSRNHSRRWCSMEGCGNRAKARRHYARERAKGSSEFRVLGSKF